MKNICPECNKETDNPKFCNSSCSAKYGNKNRKFKPSEDKRIKIINCRDCGVEIEVNIRSPKHNSNCENCRKIKRDKHNEIVRERTFCNSCGGIKGNCIRKDICRKFKIFPTLIKYFGFDETTIGTINVYGEYERIKNIIEEDYLDGGLGLPEILEKYEHYDIRNLNKIFKSLGIKTRSISEGLTNSYYTGKKEVSSSPFYKQGWHTTWNGKKVFYRSSYELNYCNILDDQKIDYEMEELRILYWDTQLQRERVAIPDFHIPEDNMIVEIKGDYTYDKQNMIDRSDMFKKLGYEFKMILEGKEYNKENLP